MNCPSSFFLQPPASSLLPWLFQQQLNGISPGLESITALLGALGDPQKKQPVFHIAGTNGKGSVAAFSASLLKAAGVRVGLYTSPHLIDFRERIQLCEEMIASEDLEEGIRRLQSAIRGWNILPTFFELTTALAFDYFARSKCDVIVLETGMGGRLDATNVETEKIACAITPIGLDHQEWLGSTLAAIAREKAGIMRPGVPVVTVSQPEEVMQVLQQESDRLGAPLKVVAEPLQENIPIGLAGSHQRWNTALALKLMEQGSWKFSEQNIEEGLNNVSWPGRFQRLSFFNNGAQELILDGAHNPAAIKQLVAIWRELFPNEQCTLVFGALADKEWKVMLELLAPIASEILLVPVASSRSVFPAEIILHFPKARVFPSLQEAFVHKKEALMKKNGKSLLHDTRPCAPILLTGSLFLVGEALSLLQEKVYRPSMQ
ncbi:MAG: bifunctional folylpolyglutamate synthase/dihydrofolate synthase [Chthoniobacterales bacterium]